MARPSAGPLRVLVDAVPAHTGGGLTYAAEQLPELAARKDLELTVLATQPLAGRLREAGPGLRIREQPVRPLPLRIAWEQGAIPLLARDHDVVYMLGNFAALAHPGPQVVVLQNPNHFGAAARATRTGAGPRVRARLALEAAVARVSVKYASLAIAVSQTLRDAVEEDLGRRAGLRTVPSGAPRLPPAASGAHERRHALVVANDYPHKDWDSVLAAFASAPDLPPLVVVGACRTVRRQRDLEERISRLPPGRISLVGEVGDRSVMASLYRQAVCLVAHSRLEAAPLTPYEALSAGAPVAAADIAAHREVCGPRAVYYDPDVAGALASAVRDASRRGSTYDGEAPMSWRDNAAVVAGLLWEAAAS